MTGFLFHASLQRNADRWVYTLDDPYIHMAIAKNLARHDVFGVTRHEFSSSVSSPLWPVLLATGYEILGVSDWLPGALAILFGVGSLFVGDRFCRLYGLSNPHRLAVGCAVVYLTPLIPLVSTGLEHSMHLFFVLLLLDATARLLDGADRHPLAMLSLASALAVASRFESLFLVAPVLAVLLLHRHWRVALGVAASAGLPVVLYGLFSWGNGSFFLPNSLMLKGNFHQVSDLHSLADFLGYYALNLLVAEHHLYATGLLLLLGLALSGRRQGSLGLVAVCLAVATVLHLQFASIGVFYRYEAYLIGAVIPVIGCLLLEPLGRALRSSIERRAYVPIAALSVGAVLLLWPLHRRAQAAHSQVLPASHHIYRQQIQMADFLREMYEPGAGVAVNDLGAVTFFTDIRVLDLWGLGSIDVARAKRARVFDRQEVDRLLQTHDVEIVMIYTDWFPNQLPQRLVEVARWSTTDPYHGEMVTFFGTSEEGAGKLRKRLRAFEGRLPSSVTVSYSG